MLAKSSGKSPSSEYLGKSPSSEYLGFQSDAMEFSIRQSKVLTAKSMTELLGPRSGTAWAGRTDEIKTQGVSESAAVAAGRDRLA